METEIKKKPISVSFLILIADRANAQLIFFCITNRHIKMSFHTHFLHSRTPGFVAVFARKRVCGVDIVASEGVSAPRMLVIVYPVNIQGDVLGLRERGAFLKVAA